MKAWKAVALAGFCAGASAAAPQLRDFGAGFELQDAPGYPVQEIVLPDEVYSGVTHADLGDLRVFNDADIVVPHALCTAPVPAADVVSEESLAVFPLERPAVPATSGSTHVDVHTAGGTSVEIQEPGLATPAQPQAELTAYVIDAREVEDPIRALHLAWTAEGPSEIAVRVEASEDLDTWRTVAPHAMLLRTAADGRALERMRVELPPARYRFLRIERSDSAAPPVVDRVTAETVRRAPPAEPRRFVPAWQAAPTDTEHVFDTGRFVPVRAARILLPAPNMNLEIALDSRAAPEAAWVPRWHGDVSSVNDAGANWRPVPVVTDRQWRLRILRGRETLGAARPSLELGYDPARLRFLAQGRGPYLLAFGSGRVAPAQVIPCGALVRDAAAGEPSSLIGQASASPAAAARFGGHDALQPPPKPTPMRQIALWAVLLFGTALLVAMAISLFRRLRTPG